MVFWHGSFEAGATAGRLADWILEQREKLEETRRRGEDEVEGAEGAEEEMGGEFGEVI